MAACTCQQIILALITLSTAYSSPQYQYPSGSLACKTYKKTRLGCSNRDLVEVPTLDHNLTTSLDLSANHLPEIKGAPFEQLHVLLHLNLSRNEIAKLSETAFRGLYSLKYLYLYLNKLTDLPNNVFADLYNLLELNLEINQFTSIPNQAISSVHSLQELFFYEDQINEINLTGFQNLTALKYMQIVAMNLETDLTMNTFVPLSHLPLETFTFAWYRIPIKYTLDGEIFATLTNVTELFTPWKALPSSESVPPLLSYLKLVTQWRNTLTEVDRTTLQHLQKLNSSLTYLSINLVTVKVVNDYSFIWTQNLTTLDLSMNEINHLSTHAFHGLRSLKTLLLNINQLSQVPSGALEVFRYSTLQYLDLSANKISNIATNAFSALGSSLKYLTIEGNEFVFHVDWLEFLAKLNHDFIKGMVDILIHEYFPLPLLQTFQITSTNSKSSIYFEPRPLCSAYPYLEEVIIPDTEIGNFPSDLALNKCSHLFHLDLSGSMKNVASLDLDNLNINISTLNTLKMARNQVELIKQIIFIKAPMLTTLDLSSNSIKSISTDIAMAYPNLESLNVDRNDLESIAGLQGLSFLQTLSAAQNQITSVPPWFVSKASTSLFMELDLSNNPFQCTCNIETFRKWILSDTNTWLQPGRYACATPETLKGVSITGIELDCRSKTPTILGIGFAIGILFCLLLMTLFKYRWHIKYKLVLIYRKYQPIPDNMEEYFVELDLRHHAYVAYNDESAEDTAWVMDNLQPNMEEGPEPLRLFIKSRDAIPGHSIIESIDENIQQSRKTILVLSPHFVDSNWCHHEMEMAKMRFFNDNLNVLILVLLGDIPEQKVPLLLRQLLCKKKYLKWPKDRAGQRLFWRRLRLEMKGPIHADLCFEL